MLSQTKMQLWYPKKAPEEPPDYDGDLSLSKDEQRQKFDNEDDHSPLSDTSDGNEEINVEFLSEDDSSRGPTPGASYYEVDKKRETIDDIEVSDFIDLDYWKMETICCGTIFRGMYDEILVDFRFIKPCKNSVFNKKKMEEST